MCSFCGAVVHLTFENRQVQMPQHLHEEELLHSHKNENESERKAREFKDRLVDYDRHSSERTTVLDDQSDYFEIDSNVWLEENARFASAIIAMRETLVCETGKEGIKIKTRSRRRNGEISQE